MSGALVVSVTVKGADIPTVTGSLKGMLKSYFSKTPGLSQVRIDADVKGGRMSVRGIREADLAEYVGKACAELATSRGWRIKTEIEEVKEEEIEAVPSSGPPATQAADSIPIMPAAEQKRSGRYRTLLTVDAMQRLAQVPKGRRDQVRQTLLALASGEWEKWGEGKLPGYNSWREEEDHESLFTIHIPEVGVIVWGRAWSVDLFGRIAYPAGAYYDSPPSPSYFMPHVIIRAVLDSAQQPSFRLNFDGHLYKEEPGLERGGAAAPEPPVDEVAYTEELYLLSPNRIEDLLNGRQMGLPLHLSEEQMDVIGVPGPILLSGEAGSGKTSVITQWLVINHLRHQELRPAPPEPLSQLFVTLGTRLRDRTKFEFSTMLPPLAQNHRTEFKTYRELLWGILEMAGLRSRYPESTEMTFERFMREYAPGLAHTKIDPVLLWDEIRSVIKGGVTADPDSFMDIAKYHQLSEERGQCKTPQHLREDYYEAALTYRSYLTKNRQWDGIDLARAALLASDVAPKYGKVACDEVQDLAPIEIVLLFKLIERQDISDLFFTGDIAQVINPSGFQWSRLKKELGEHSGKRPIPDVHFLKRNYRSCYEIVDLVNRILSVRRELINDEISGIELIPLLPARVKPMVLRNSPLELLKSLQSNPNTRLILTKNLGERLKLEGLLGAAVNQVTILTIEEAKGLEYEGALLWNFFLPRHEKITRNDWESVFIPDRKGRLKKEIERGEKNPYGLTYEFNLLHVGLTRPRRLLFFYDEDPKMRIANLGEDVAGALTSADLDDFEVHWKTEVPSPDDLSDAATRLLNRDTEQARRLFILAAQAFEKRKELARAAECYEAASSYDQAARCFKASGDRPNELNMLSHHHEKLGESGQAASLQRERGETLLKLGANLEASEAFEDARRLYELAPDLKAAADCAWASAEAIPTGRNVDRAVAFQYAAECAKKASDLDRAVRAYDRAILAADSARQAGKRILPGEPIEDWIASGHLEVARLNSDLSRCAEAAKAARQAGGLWQTLAESPDWQHRRGQYEDRFREALAFTVESLIRAGETTPAAARQKELLASFEKSGGVEEIKEQWNSFADLYFQGSEYELYVETKRELADLLKNRNEHQLALLLLQDAISRCNERRLTRLVLTLAEKRVDIAQAGGDWAEVASSRAVEAQCLEELGDLLKAFENLRQAGVAYLKDGDEEQAEHSYDRAAGIASKAMSAIETGWFCFKDVAIDAYASRSRQQSMRWIDRASGYFAQDMEEAQRRLERFREEQVSQVQRLDGQRAAAESTSRKLEISQRRESELRIQAWTELALAMAHVAAVRVSGDPASWQKAEGWLDQAHASFDASGDQESLRDLERLTRELRRTRS